MSKGFTLVEVLVALAIVVVSMGLLFKLIGMDLDRSREAGRETEAAALIQSLFANPATTPGITKGTAQDGLSWALSVTPYGGDRKDWRVDAVTVAATVSWDHDGRVESRTLSTLRVVPKGVPQ